MDETAFIAVPAGAVQVYVSTGAGALAALPDSSVQVILEKMRPTLRRRDYDDAVEQVRRRCCAGCAAAVGSPAPMWHHQQT